ncbi:UDP-N-acetylglucosamine--LPS N-acetylglucosamine transferase [Paenibacillus hemerocallicola]|uniref:UDP-N-acetylglucosamine--LPS N-acetylglucosamine transferase n=1 Tax=Paenibacillus hemerocallicola TaxID=1172614 RepID=A0A5C4SWH7_9BACL|nr:glycosyltransferase [Paenibacillus hemerocallicola]TNJ57145.1 UDP-N-acetylglucosamine--LPS N-acetylglucosamine transferase [Paenibacillus hemerocallicola]
MRKKRILLLSEGFGAGHTQAAHALSVGLRQLSPDLQTRVLELGAFLHPTLARLVFSAYRKTIVSKPKLYGFVYRKQYKKSLNRLTRLALHRLFYGQTTEVIKQLKPDTIVCTHPFPSAVISRLKRAGLSVPLCTVITDYDAHGTWISPEVNKYLVSTEEVKHKLLMRGVPDDHIEVTGIPVHPKFWRQHDKEELRLRFGLQAVPTVLVMGGGWGLVQQEETLRHMIGWRDRLQFIFCMGSNEKALARLADDPRFKHPHILLMGFTREIDKLMDVSDLLITKPGGMTCTEGLAKGLPMLFYSPIPGQEEENCLYFTERGFGEQIKSLQTLDFWFEKLTMATAKENRPNGSGTSLLAYNPITCHQAIMRMLS